MALPNQHLLSNFPGINVMITGNVPIASGLSSSSSLVVCSGTMGLVALDLHNKINKKVFVENLVKYERMLGTACGGMDQTASAFGEKNKALHIEFDPLRVFKVNLPIGYTFVIANSLTISEKLKSLGTRYNKRVCECRFALAIIKKKLNLEENLDIKNLSQLQNHLKMSFEEVVKIGTENLSEKPYSLSEIEEIIGVGVENILKDIPYYELVLSSNTEYFPYHRMRHVFEEASRVYQFRDACLEEKFTDNEKALKLGLLMNQSHDSCKKKKLPFEKLN